MYIYQGRHHYCIVIRITYILFYFEMGPSPAKPGMEASPVHVGRVYYGVYIPPDIQPASEDNERVSSDKCAALKMVKKYKKARFKAFRKRSEAMQFAIFGMETTGQTGCPTSPLPAESGEKPSPFRAPKPQDMVRFRKAIESGDIDFVKRTVWENPRYIVSSGDTPAILQEGSRYNALHIAARSRDATLCAFILETVNSNKFMHHFYGDSTDADQRCTVMLDLYLNTPDKGLNETPLHFATKFGAVQVVRVLVSYPQCDRSATNKFQQTAKDVICSRMTGADTALREEILVMLSEQFYVPVLRSPDNSVEPVVGQPFSPNSPLQVQSSYGNALSPVLEVQALAGPMPRQTAEKFRRRWKTPPRILGSPLLLYRPALTDQDKGWEKVGRELAQEWKVPWKEYWPFLDTYTDLSSCEGLQLLEEYFHRRFKSPVDSASPDDSVSVVIQPPTPSAESPVSELCNALRACRLSSGSRPHRHPSPHQHRTSHQRGDGWHGHASDNSIPAHVTSPHIYVEKSCEVFAKRISDGLQLSEDLDFLTTEMRHLSSLVISCQSDIRFQQLDFSRLHSHLGRLVAARLEVPDLPRIMDSLHAFIDRGVNLSCSSDEDELIASPYNRRKRPNRHNRAALQSAAVCVARAILCAAEPPAPQQLESEQDCLDAMTQMTPCTCRYPAHHTVTQKKLVFKEDDCNGVTAESSERGDVLVEKCPSTPVYSSGEESDTSDTSESEYCTPPSSPGVRSDDDLAMESPDEGPDVYINGNTPSKLDMAVLEAIRDSEINQAKYPNIYRWRHLVLLHSQNERQSWLSSPMPSSSRLPSSPMWHRTPSLYYY